MVEVKTEKGEVNLQEFLEENFSKEFVEEVAVEHTLAQVAGKVIRAKEESGLSIREISERMGRKSMLQVQHILNDGKSHNVTLNTLVRFCYMCGFELDIKFVLSKKE